MTKFTRGRRVTFDTRYPRDDEDPEIEIHNHMPSATGNYEHRDDEEPEEKGDGDVVARYPANFHAAYENNQLVIRSAPREGTDESAAHSNLAFDRAKTRDSRRAPRTLAEMNKFNSGYYGKQRKTAAR